MKIFNEIFQKTITSTYNLCFLIKVVLSVIIVRIKAVCAAEMHVMLTF